jgi:hypothetical protein
MLVQSYCDRFSLIKLHLCAVKMTGRILREIQHISVQTLLVDCSQHVDDIVQWRKQTSAVFLGLGLRVRRTIEIAPPAYERQLP